jgi:hypothetical protein
VVGQSGFRCITADVTTLLQKILFSTIDSGLAPGFRVKAAKSYGQLSSAMFLKRQKQFFGLGPFGSGEEE